MIQTASRNEAIMPSETISVVAQAGGCSARSFSITNVVRATEITPLAARRKSGKEWTGGNAARDVPPATR